MVTSQTKERLLIGSQTVSVAFGGSSTTLDCVQYRLAIDVLWQLLLIVHLMGFSVITEMNHQACSWTPSWNTPFLPKASWQVIHHCNAKVASTYAKDRTNGNNDIGWGIRHLFPRMCRNCFLPVPQEPVVSSPTLWMSTEILSAATKHPAYPTLSCARLCFYSILWISCTHLR